MVFGPENANTPSQVTTPEFTRFSAESTAISSQDFSGLPSTEMAHPEMVAAYFVLALFVAPDVSEEVCVVF